MKEYKKYKNEEEAKLLKKEMREPKMKYFLPIITTALVIFFIFALLLVQKKNLPSSPGKSNLLKSFAQNDWDDSYEKAKKFVSKLSFDEKMLLMIGTENMRSVNDGGCVGQIDPIRNGKVDFKGMCLQDGPAGVRYARGTGISWQSNLNLAASFNKNLMYDVGKAQGEENKEKGINTFLSPCVNIMRTPQAGRVWEAYGEDPFYSGVCASQMIKGIQDAGVIATIKHFVGNDQETYRHASSSNIKMAPLMDIYVEPFYRAIHDANVGSVMSAYNAVNDVYCSENKFLLTDVLRGILDFKGFVMSDWWAVYNDKSENINSGLDMNMPGGEGWGQHYGIEGSYWRKIKEYVQKGEIKEERITEAATRVIATMYQMNQMENFPQKQLYKETKTEDRKKLQRKAATESQVLLKNEDNILPLKNVKTIAVIGNGAQKRNCPDDNDMMCGYGVQNGFIPLGYGSGTTTFSYLISPIEGITELAEKKGIKVISSGGLNGREEKYNEGAQIALQADVAIVFVQADSGEEYGNVESSKGDRADLDAWHGGNLLVEKVANANKNTIVVINAPATVSVPWLDNVKAVLFTGFPGAESGYAIADILFGEVNPSGHLPFVWAEMNDYCTKIDHLATNNKPSGSSNKEQYDYTEGLYVGQRFFNKQNKKPVFPFGHGLTYTTFEYSDLKLSMSEEGLSAQFNVKNTGKLSGSAVPMLFLTFPESIGDYPKYIFKGFEKVELEPGENKNVNIIADDHALSYFNVEENKYVRVNSGTIEVSIAENGDPSQSILKGEIDSKF